MPPGRHAGRSVALEVDRADIDDQPAATRAAVQHVEQPLTNGGRVVFAFLLLRGIQASQPGIHLVGQGGCNRLRQRGGVVAYPAWTAPLDDVLGTQGRSTGDAMVAGARC